MLAVPTTTPRSCPTPDTGLSTSPKTTCSLESLMGDSTTCTVEFKGKTEKGSPCTLPSVRFKCLLCFPKFPNSGRTKGSSLLSLHVTKFAREFPLPHPTHLHQMSPSLILCKQGHELSPASRADCEFSTHHPTHHGYPPTTILQAPGPTLGKS